MSEKLSTFQCCFSRNPTHKCAQPSTHKCAQPSTHQCCQNCLSIYRLFPQMVYGLEFLCYVTSAVIEKVYNSYAQRIVFSRKDIIDMIYSHSHMLDEFIAYCDPKDFKTDFATPLEQIISQRLLRRGLIYLDGNAESWKKNVGEKGLISLKDSKIKERISQKGLKRQINITDLIFD